MSNIHQNTNTCLCIFPFPSKLNRFRPQNKYNINMFKHVFLILLLLSKIACKFQQVNNILILTDDDFEEARNFYSHLFVFFYNPSTSDHWKYKSLEFDKLAKFSVIQAKVDVTLNPQLFAKYATQNNFVYFRKKFHINYWFYDRAEMMINWIKHAREPYIRIDTKRKFEEIMENPKSKVLYFGKSQGKNFEAWRTASFHELQTQFVLIENEKLFGEYTDGTILLAKKYNIGQTDFSDSDVRKWVYLKYSGTEFLSAWLWAHSNSHFHQFLKILNEESQPFLVLFSQNSSYSHANYVFEQFCATLSLSDEPSILCGKITQKQNSYVYNITAEWMRIPAKGQYLILKNQKPREMYLYPYNIEEITKYLLANWIEEFQKGNLIPWNLIPWNKEFESESESDL